MGEERLDVLGWCRLGIGIVGHKGIARLGGPALGQRFGLLAQQGEELVARGSVLLVPHRTLLRFPSTIERNERVRNRLGHAPVILHDTVRLTTQRGG